MRKTHEAQLALLELPPPTKRPGARGPRPMSPALTARHCNALLAEIHCIALAERARATHLAELITAVERAHEPRARDAERSVG